MSTWQLLKYPGVAIILIITMQTKIMAAGYTPGKNFPTTPSYKAERHSVVPIFWFTPVDLGGLGLSASQISFFFGAQGAAQTFWALCVTAPLHRRIGSVGIMWGCALLWGTYFFASMPVANTLIRYGHDTAGWTVAVAGATIGAGVSMGFSKFTPFCENAAVRTLLMY